MPYNPQVQDISGQLIAQGMSQASAARAQAIQSIGQSITGGIKQYQQNQFLTKQAMGKFGGQLQDPNFKKYVDSVLGGDPNAPTVPEPLKKALQNAQKGQVDVYDAALLGNMVDAYQDNLRGQLLRAQAEATKPKMPEGQIMDMATYRATIAAYPEVDFQAKMLPDGRVAVQSGGARAPAAPRPLAIQPMGGGVGAFDPATGELRRFTPNVPEGAMPNDPRLLSMVPGQPMAAAPAPAPAPAAAAPAVPPMLSRFQQAAEAPAGPMALGRFMQAPAQAGPMASLGQFAGPPRAAVAAPAPAPAPAAAAPAAPAPTQARGLQMVDIPGGKRDIERREAEQQRIASERARLEKANNLMFTIEGIEPLIGPLSVGFVGQKTKGQGGTPAASMNLLLKQVQAATAFDELAKLKESKTSLGQVAIKEIELLQNAVVALDQDMSEEVFRRQFARLKERTQQTIQRLNILERDRQAGLTEPSQDYFKIGGKTLEDLNREAAAKNAPADPLTTLEKGGKWRVRK